MQTNKLIPTKQKIRIALTALVDGLLVFSGLALLILFSPRIPYIPETGPVIDWVFVLLSIGPATDVGVELYRYRLLKALKKTVKNQPV